MSDSDKLAYALLYIEELRAAIRDLLRAGWHNPECPSHYEEACNCGMDDRYQAARAIAMKQPMCGKSPDPLHPLRDIAANNSADPVLANIEQGVRDGLAESDTEGKDQ